MPAHVEGVHEARKQMTAADYKGKVNPHPLYREPVRGPVGRVYKRGREWILRAFGSFNTWPVGFKTKRAAVEQAVKDEHHQKHLLPELIAEQPLIYKGVVARTDADEERVLRELTPPKKRRPKPRRLSRIVRDVNKANAPPGGWGPGDLVGEAELEEAGLTKAEAQTLRVVLDSGGDVLQTQGRLSSYPWAAQKATLSRLQAKGYIEGNVGGFAGQYRPSEMRPYPTWSPEQRDTFRSQHYIFATAAGIRALMAYEQKHGEAKRPHRFKPEEYPSHPLDLEPGDPGWVSEPSRRARRRRR